MTENEARIILESEMLKRGSEGQLIGVQSSAPAAKDRWRADNRAISAKT